MFLRFGVKYCKLKLRKNTYFSHKKQPPGLAVTKNQTKSTNRVKLIFTNYSILTTLADAIYQKINLRFQNL
ncbi:hypothetical protein GCM10022397_18890 [Flavivirga jejuensis]